jgi:maleate cis-trans isomerase
MKKLCVVSLNESDNLNVPMNIPITSNVLDINQNSNDFSMSHSESESSECDTKASQPVKRKRQRLNHLSQEEKLMRRKLKNRIAAQSARDRKKVKMDDLETTCEKLKLENSRLKKECDLLKEKAKILVDENRKLLKFKSDTEKSQLTLVKQEKTKIIDQLSNQSGLNVSNISICEANSMKTLGADESAVFTKYASQQKRQLQEYFQRMIYMLILQTLSLLKGEMVSVKISGSNQASQIKITKLKVSLQKLMRLANTRCMPPKPKQTIRIMNTYRKVKVVSSFNLAMLISVIGKALDVKKQKKFQL